MAPTFFTVGGNVDKPVNIQDIVLDDTDSEGANIQVLDENGLFTEYFYWYKRRDKDGMVGPEDYRIPCPEGKKGVWFEVIWNEDYTEPEDYVVATKVFEYGDGFQIEIDEGSLIGFSGEVTGDDILTKTLPHGSWNYYANPFPAMLNIQNIQMTDTDSEAVNIQVLDENGLFTEYFYWYKRRDKDGMVGPEDYRIPCPEGKKGVWFEVIWNEDYTEPEDYQIATRDFDPAEGFMLEGDEETEFTMLAPFDL